VKPEDLQGVTITFWHVWSRGTGEELQKMVDEFNATNEWGITVEAVNQQGYGQMFDKMNAAINSGDLPNLVVGYNNQMLAWDDAGGVIADMTPYVDDPVYGLSKEEQADFYPTFWNQDVVDGKRLGFPVMRSAQVMFYNETWAKELGFDAPPKTVDEFKAQACAAAEANNNDDNPDNDGTGGYILHAGASVIANWIWAFGGDITDDSGKYTFDTPEAQAAVEYLKDLYDSGCAWSGVNKYPNPEFATRQALFTTSSIAGLPYQQKAMEKNNSTDEWKITNQLTLNAGLRFDQMWQYVDANQLSPRISLTWKPYDGTTFHAGYTRTFTPPERRNSVDARVVIFKGRRQKQRWVLATNLWDISGRQVVSVKPVILPPTHSK